MVRKIKRNRKQTKTEKQIKGETLKVKESVYVKISFKGEKKDEKS